MPNSIQSHQVRYISESVYDYSDNATPDESNEKKKVDSVICGLEGIPVPFIINNRLKKPYTAGAGSGFPFDTSHHYGPGTNYPQPFPLKELRMIWWRLKKVKFKGTGEKRYGNDGSPIIVNFDSNGENGDWISGRDAQKEQALKYQENFIFAGKTAGSIIFDSPFQFMKTILVVDGQYYPELYFIENLLSPFGNGEINYSHIGPFKTINTGVDLVIKVGTTNLIFTIPGDGVFLKDDISYNFKIFWRQIGDNDGVSFSEGFFTIKPQDKGAFFEHENSKKEKVYDTDTGKRNNGTDPFY